jgi:hypothetical protein
MVPSTPPHISISAIPILKLSVSAAVVVEEAESTLLIRVRKSEIMEEPEVEEVIIASGGCSQRFLLVAL